MSIKEQYATKSTESKKDLKPKPVTRPAGKDVARNTRDMVADRQGGGYKTR